MKREILNKNRMFMKKILFDTVAPSLLSANYDEFFIFEKCV
jgi:hypothetical protein